METIIELFFISLLNAIAERVLFIYSTFSNTETLSNEKTNKQNKTM